MVRCPNCKMEVSKPLKDWKYGVFHVNMYKCSCGNQFRQYFHKGKVRFVLSAHDGNLAKGRRQKRTRA